MSIVALVAILGLNRVSGQVQVARSLGSDHQATANCGLPPLLVPLGHVMSTKPQ
jgi:hypothetical protein